MKSQTEKKNIARSTSTHGEVRIIGPRLSTLLAQDEHLMQGHRQDPDIHVEIDVETWARALSELQLALWGKSGVVEHVMR